MKVIIRISAENDIQEIVYWYENIREGLGDEFLNDLESTLTYLEKFARSFRVRYKNFRIVSLSQFPYLVYFRIVQQTIIVQKISHAHRSKRRLKI